MLNLLRPEEHRLKGDVPLTKKRLSTVIVGNDGKQGNNAMLLCRMFMRN